MKFGIEIVCDSQRRRIGIEQVVTIPENRFREHIRRILRRRCREKQHVLRNNITMLIATQLS